MDNTIDEIFKNKKKKKDITVKHTESSSNTPTTSKKRSPPETLFDPSCVTGVPKKRNKVETNIPDGDAQRSKNDVRKKKKKQGKVEKDDREQFKDSRGTGPRRRTEEGFAIYKEDELGIGNEGGDTPLCPFDCQCCF